MTQSTALERLQREANSATSGTDFAAAWARVGIWLAQGGRVDEGREVVTKLRSIAQGSERYSILSIGILAVEGVIAYYSDRSSESLDRLKRAYVLANAANSHSLRGQTAIWLAHVAYNFDDLSAFGSALATAVSYLDFVHDVERSRLCLIVADALQFCGDWHEATHWYRLARLLSRKLRDHAVLVAIEHNRLASGLSRLRLTEMIGLSSDAATHRAWLLELESVRQLHFGFQVDALMPLITLCEAWQAQANGKFLDAASAIERLIAREEQTVVGSTVDLLLIESVWCRSMGGESLSAMSQSLPSIDNVLKFSADQRLVALYYYMQFGERLFSPEECALIESVLTQERVRCIAELDRMREIVDVALSEPVIVRRKIEQLIESTSNQ